MAANARILMGVVGLAATLTLSSAAAAQNYPNPNYPNPNYPNPNYPNPNYPDPNYPNQSPGGVIGEIVNSYRYGQYPYGNYGYNQYGNQRMAIDQCARAVEARLNGGGYGNGNWGYNGQGYNRYRNSGRVEGITRIVPKGNGFRVFGVASSGWGGYQGYNRHGYGTYGYGNGADLRWDCRIDNRGRISDLDINRRDYNWRGY